MAERCEMARFTVRVELHDADWKDYTKLHERMYAQGFNDEVSGGEGIRYKLPPAEYNFDGAADRDQILAKAKTAASGVVRKFAVLVTESAGRSWEGLERVTKSTSIKA